MIGRYFFFCLTVVAFLCSCAGKEAPKPENPVHAAAAVSKPPPSTEPTEYYVLGEGDTVDLNVWRQEGLKRSMKVDLQGNVSVPLAGNVRVAGLTVKEATEEITQRLGKYFVDPQVDLFVSGAKNQTVLIFGEVANPGPYIIDHKMSVWEVAAKGAFTKYSSKSKVLLIRNVIPNGDPANIKVAVLNLDPTKVKEGSFPTDPYVQNGDIMYVPPTMIADLDRLMTHINSIIAPILGMESGIVLLPQVWDVLRGVAVSTSGGIIVGH